MSENEAYAMDIEGEDKVVTLAEVAGIDMTTVVAEFSTGFSLTPEGVFEWRITSALLEPLEWTDGKGVDKSALTAVFNLEAIGCRQVKSDEFVAADLVGTEHQERFFLSNFIRDMGNLKAFFVAIGMQGTGTLQDILDQSVGIEFAAGIKHRKNKNDPDRPFANLDTKAIEALVLQAAPAAVAVAQPAAAVAAAPTALGGLQLGVTS